MKRSAAPNRVNRSAMRRIRSCLPGLVSLALLVPASAQEVETGFEREVNRFRWTSTAHYGVENSKWRLEVHNRFLSDAFILFGDQLRFRDENRLTLEAERRLGDGRAVGLRARTDWFGLSRTFMQEAYGIFRARLPRLGFVEPRLGVVWDRRPGAAAMPLRLDAGPAFGFAGALTPRPLTGYTVRIEGESAWQRITPRRGHAVRMRGEATRRFGQARLASGVRFSSQRRDTYRAVSFLNRDAPTEAIEATTSDTIEVNFQFETPVFGGLRLLGQMDVRANNRLIRTHDAPESALFFETDFNRRAVDADVGIVYDTPNLAGRLSVERGAATERRRLANRASLPPPEAAQKTNLLRQADYEEGIYGLRGRLRAAILRRVTLSVTGSSRIVRHDTPEVNLDDRDEIYHNGEVGLQLRLSRYVQSDVRVFGSFYHAVYLSAERSAENNVQRSLRLRPSIRWRPSERTDIRFAAEVRATYTVDDFVLPGRRPSDQSAREMRLETEVERRLGQEAVLRARGSISDLRLGRLLWNEFAEIPFDTLRTHSAWIHLQTGRRLVADIGWRIFLRSDFDRALSVHYPLEDDDGRPLLDGAGRVRKMSISRPGRRWIEQQGPTAALVWRAGTSVLRLDAWVNMQHIRRRLYGGLPAGAADRIRAAAAKGTRRLIPTVALTVSWRL